MPKPRIRFSISQGPVLTFDVEDLGPEMNAQFQALYRHAYLNEAMDWGAFNSTALRYFDAVTGDSEGHSAYFNNFTPIWVKLWNNGQTANALGIWPRSLVPAYEWETGHPGARIHKGSPYYFWGGTAVLAGNLETGFLLIHSAVEEDRLDTGKENPDLPAWKFVTLEDTSPQQLFRPVVADLAQFLDSRVKRYNGQCGGTLTLDDIKTKFLQQPLLREPTFYFVYSLFRASQHIRTDPRLIDDVFAPLVHLNTLLDFYMVLEVLLQQKFAGSRQLNPLITEFSNTMGYSVHQADPSLKRPRLVVVKEAFENDPQATLIDLLDGTFKYTALSSAEAALAAAPPMRNYSAHRITSQPVFAQRFDGLLQLALSAIFLALERLY